MEEEFSFEDVYRQVTWELCVEAASIALTDLVILVYEDGENPHNATRSRTTEAAIKKLVAAGNGGLRISGTWKAGGKKGELDAIDIQLTPTATEVYLERFVQESIRLQIAKQLHSMGTSPLDLGDE
jgi:hypothetical protein